MSHNRIAVIVAGIMLWTHCANASDGRLRGAEARVRDAVWQYHLAVIKEAVSARGEPNVTIDLTQFGRSISVIESLTKILSNTGSRVGRIPTPQLPRTVELWEQWYARHRDKIQVDMSGCSLRLTK